MVIDDLAIAYPSREAWAKEFMGEEEFNKDKKAFNPTYEDSGKVYFSTIIGKQLICLRDGCAQDYP